MWRPETGLEQAIILQASSPHNLLFFFFFFFFLICHFLFAGKSLVICAYTGTISVVGVLASTGGWVLCGSKYLRASWKWAGLIRAQSMENPGYRGWQLVVTEDTDTHHLTQLPIPGARGLVLHLCFGADWRRG